MTAYYCDRCGKAIVDGTIYRVAITAESVSILGTCLLYTSDAADE